MLKTGLFGNVIFISLIIYVYSQKLWVVHAQPDVVAGLDAQARNIIDENTRFESRLAILTPTSRGSEELWSKIVFLILVSNDTV